MTPIVGGPFIHEDAEFGDLLKIVSQKLGIATGLVEKDYWVTHVLWGLTELGLAVWFKGGTSLSKGYGLIERFSEDLDLKVEAPGVLPEVRSWSSAGSTRVEEREQFFLELEGLLSRIPGVVSVRLDETQLDERWRSANYHVHYAGDFKTEVLPVRGFVLLEIGSARVDPHEVRALSSWVHDHLSEADLIAGYRDNRPTGIRCVHPAVTLLEKLEAISRRFERGDDPASFIRHYEDAARIIREYSKLPELAQRPQELYWKMKATRDLRTDLAPSDPAFNPGRREEWSELHSAYGEIGPMYWGKRTPLKSCCNAIRGWIAQNLGR